MAPSRSEELLRLERSDHATEHLVLHVADHSTSPDTLDLKLVGTDSECLYGGNVKESSLETLQASNFTGDSAEFKTVLSYALLHQRPEGPFPDILEGLETVAAISGKTLTVTIRKNISGITQKLGAIRLEENTKNLQVDFIEWTDAALIDRDDLRAQLAGTQQKAKEQQAEVAKLSTELDRLVKAKKQHEEEMLSKFAALLNAKKLKIRDQQRLLSNAKIDVDAAEEVEEARSASGKSSRRAGASRKGKRKASGSAVPTPAEVEDQGDDATVDGTEDGQEEERRRQETPETDEEDVADEDVEVDEDGSGMTNAIDDSQTTRRVARQQTRQSRRGSQKMNVDKHKSPPPPRKLPSRKAKSPSKEPTPPPQPNAGNDEDDDETDDEL